MRPNRLKPIFLRRLTVANVLMLVLGLGMVGGDLPGPAERAGITAAAGEHRFNLAIWELGHLGSFVSNRSNGNPETLGRYFELAEARRLQDQRLLRTVSDATSSTSDEASATRVERVRIAAEMEALEGDTISAIRSIVSKILIEHRLTTKFPAFGERLFPPVSFALEDLPRVLVVSPRDRIDLIDTVVLRPDITADEMESIEKGLERRDLSAVVDRIGGMATYPSLVREDPGLRQAISTVAHEWVHHYLFFRPLGRRYAAGNEMTTINETFANIVGAEIAASHFGEGPPSFSVSLEPPEPIAAEERFDANRYLRETRERTDDLLAEGRIEDAEAYMEERRAELGENGVFIRKLNQAFFAFRGTYADSPASVSPVFRQLTLLRRTEPTLKSFVDSVAAIRSPDGLETLVAEKSD